MKRALILSLALLACYDVVLAIMLSRQALTPPSLPVSATVVPPPAETQPLVKQEESEASPTKRYRLPKSLSLISEGHIESGGGTKSCLVSEDGSYVYALNLEGMSVSEFDRKAKKARRTLKFHPTEAQGYDYQKREWVNSKAEKPVEGSFSHKGRYLWISLHNADGVVAFDLQKPQNSRVETGFKSATLTSPSGLGLSRKAFLPYLGTGKTPKSIVESEGRLYVSNWHSNDVSVLDISSDAPSEWSKVTDLDGGATPRGIAVSDSLLYIGQMGSNTVSVYNVETLELIRKIVVGPNPRHIVIQKGYLYASLSSPDQIVKVNLKTFALEKVAETGDQPKTITLSDCGTLLFAVCYEDDLLQAFRTSDMKKLGEWPCKGGPFGLDLWQNEDRIEVWAACYRYGVVRYYAFDVKRVDEAS